MAYGFCVRQSLGVCTDKKKNVSAYLSIITGSRLPCSSLHIRSPKRPGRRPQDVHGLANVSVACKWLRAQRPQRRNLTHTKRYVLLHTSGRTLRTRRLTSLYITITGAQLCACTGVHCTNRLGEGLSSLGQQSIKTTSFAAGCAQVPWHSHRATGAGRRPRRFVCDGGRPNGKAGAGFSEGAS